MIKIDILSDPICPWCLIGKTFLDRALEIRPDHVFTLEWHPYMLNPKMPKNGMGREEYLINKFGSKHNATEAYQKIIETISKDDIEVNFNKIKRTPNTLDAHRLIHWAQWINLWASRVFGVRLILLKFTSISSLDIVSIIF